MLAYIFDAVPLRVRQGITLAFYALAALAFGSAFFAESAIGVASMLWAAIALVSSAMFLHINIRTGVFAESVAPRASALCMLVFAVAVLGLVITSARFDGMSL